MKYIILLLIILAPVLCHAEIYKWVDENGRTHFSDKPTSKSATSYTPKEKIYSDYKSDGLPKPSTPVRFGNRSKKFPSEIKKHRTSNKPAQPTEYYETRKGNFSIVNYNIYRSLLGDNEATVTIQLLGSFGNSTFFNPRMICATSDKNEKVCANGGSDIRMREGDQQTFSVKLSRTKYPLARLWLKK